MEIWKTVTGLTVDWIEVSSLGRVRTCHHRTWRAPIGNKRGHWRNILGRVLTPCPNVRGYLRVAVPQGGSKQSMLYVHILVCRAFNGEPNDPELEVCHRDDDKGNNVPDNLYWGTHLQNAADAMKNKRYAYGDAHWTRSGPTTGP